MKKRFFLKLFSSIFLSTIVTTPLILTSCSNSLNYIESPISNANDNKENNKKENKGFLSNELRELERKEAKLHYMNVPSEITFKDFERGSKDNSGRTLFIHERGNLLENKLQLALKQNKDDFIKNFSFNSYLNSLNEQQKEILNPKNETFLKDIKLFMISLFYENNELFSIGVKNNNLSNIIKFNNNENTISFNVTFFIKNDSNVLKTFKFENINKEIYPNSEIELTLSVTNAKVNNVINFISNRFLLGWEINDVFFKIGADNGIIKSFVPNKKMPSYSYNIEFFNLVNEFSDYRQSSNGSKEFMNSLNPTFLKEQLSSNILNNQKMIFDIFPNIASIFGTLEKNLTFGETMAELSSPLVYILKKFNFNSEFIINFANDLLKSFDTGETLLKIFVDNKKEFIDFISVNLGSSFGDLNVIISMIFDPISLDMTEETKKEILSFFDTLDVPDINKIKTLVVKVFNNEPTIDVIDYFLTNLKEQIKNIIGSNKINDDTYNIIFEIINILLDREKKPNGSTIINGKKVFYKNNVLNIFFEDINAKKWLYNSFATILMSYGTDIKGMQMGLIDDVINQMFLQNSKISINSIQIILKELRNAFLFLGNKDNYEVVIEYKKDVKYDNLNNRFDFEAVSKIILKKDYTFSLDKFFNILPRTIKLAFSKLGQDVVNEVNKWAWALRIFGFDTTYVTIKTNLLTRILPKRISFREKDAFVVKYTPVDGKLYYKQQKKFGNYYHGFTSMLNAQYYIEQRSLNDGVISNLYREFNDPSDYSEVAENLIQYEYQAPQNYKMFDEYTQKLFVNRINTTIWFNGQDINKPILSPLDEKIYRNGKVFRWYDTDYTNELFKVGSSGFLSKAFNHVIDKVKYRHVNELGDISSYRVVNSKGDTEKVLKNRNESYFDRNDQLQIENTLYYLGSGINSNEITRITNPLFHLKTEKDIGIGFNFLGLSLNFKRIYLKMEFLAFETSILFPYSVLDTTNYYKENNGTIKLNNLKFSNKFSKTFIIPRFSIVL